MLLADNSKSLSNKVKQYERSLLEYDGILHDRAKNGTGGGTHHFFQHGCATVERPAV